MGTAAATGFDEARELVGRADRLCERVPRVQERVETVLERLRVDGGTRGSIAWLGERAEQARQEGHETLAVALDNRAVIRTERVDVLEAREEALADAASWCAGRAGEDGDASGLTEETEADLESDAR